MRARRHTPGAPSPSPLTCGNVPDMTVTCGFARCRNVGVTQHCSQADSMDDSPPAGNRGCRYRSEGKPKGGPLRC
jgi:hypothetical protein